jgi:hypothetical protein
MLRYDVPVELLANAAGHPLPTLKVDVVNADPSTHVSLEDIFIYTSSTGTLVPVVDLTSME